MSTGVKKLENAKVELQIEIPEEIVNQEYDKVFKQIQRNSKIDGFRKGKVPVEIIIKKFKEAADREVAENLIKSGYVDAVQENEISPINTPEFEFNAIRKDKPFSFKAVVEVYPTVEIGNYKGISIEEDTCNIKDIDIDNELQSLRERHASVSKKEGSPEKGDMVRISYKRIDNITPEERESAQPEFISILLGKDSSEYAFDEHIYGMSVDQEKEAVIKYPKDYISKELAGQKVTYLIRLIAVNKVDMPALDDEFAKDMGEYSTIDELKKEIRKNLELYVEEASRRRVKNELVSRIVESSKFDIPETMIMRETGSVIKRLQDSMGLQNIDLEKILDKSDVNKDEFFKKAREEAESNVKSSLILFEISRKEELKVKEEKYREVLEQFARRTGKSIEEVEKFTEEKGSRENIESELMLEEAMDFVYQNSAIKKKKPVSFSEFNTKR